MATELALPEDAAQRPTTSYSSLSELSKPFLIDPTSRSYKHQYANIYFVRLVELRPIVEERANERWKNVRGKPPLLPRVLNLQRSQLCYIVGTIYLDMPLKPNVLEDMARDHWLAPPAPRPKFYSAQDAVHLEDESGRVRLVGERIRYEREREGGGLVTGVIMAALGFETSSGDFEVVDVCFAGLPDVYTPQTTVDKGKAKAENGDHQNGSSSKTWVAMASGLSMGAQEAPADVKAEMLIEWLTGEAGSLEDQLDGGRIARLILAGNTLAMPVKGEDDRKIKRFNASTRDPLASHPTKTASLLLSDILASSLPVNLIPGPADPAGSTLPQQPLPKVMFGPKGKTDGLESMTNPAWMEVGERSILGTGGQTLDDIFKYLPSTSRLAMARRTLEWRHIAPTAPDTLCKIFCLRDKVSPQLIEAGIYPFPDADPFIIHNRPHVYVIGNQPEFETALVGDEDSPTRIVLLPSFAKTGTLVLVCVETLECKTVEFEVPVWAGQTNGTHHEADGDVKMEE